MKKYNVLLIMTDQQRWDSLGCYGNSVIETPNLDWLASEGTVFCNAYSPSPSCIPARACLLTGRDPWNTGILGMGGGQGPLGILPISLPGELSKAGYHTQGIGKMHFYPQRTLNGFHHTVLDESSRSYNGFVSDYKQWFDRNKTGDYNIADHGMDWNSWMARPYHAPEFLHPTNWTINESFKFMKRRDSTKPFFLKISFARPHSPYDAVPYYFDLYLNKKLPEPQVGDWAHIHDVKEDAAKPNAWRGVRSQEEIHRARAGYYGSINHIDHQIGRFLMYLNDWEPELFNNTIIIFTSDHGDMLGDNNLWRKGYAYEGSAHVPLIIRLPKSMGKPIQQRVEQPVLLQDIMPTILDTLSLEIPETVTGKSMLGLMNGKTDGWREYAHGEHVNGLVDRENQYLSDGKFKYIWFPRLGTEQLFNLTKDPYECVNLAEHPEYQDELVKWRNRMIDVLEPRNAGLTEGNQLICQADKPVLISPNNRSEELNKNWHIANQRNPYDVIFGGYHATW